MCLDKSRIWKNSGSWDIGQNTLGQWDCRVFKSTISLEQNDEKAWSFAWWFKFFGIKTWLENIGVGMGINWCAHSVCMTVKLVATEEEINRINWFLVC